MSISQLTGYIGQANIADSVDEITLADLGRRVKRQFDEDLESMDEWIKSVEEGIKLMKQEWQPKSTPWQGASNYKDPILTEASVKFGDKATLELLRNPDLLSSDIIGKDPDGQKKEISERISEAMNYQINYDMGDWREDQERLFYSLPNYGTVFKKITYDEVEQKAESTVICYPDFAVNQATKSMDTCRSFSHVLDFSLNAINERINNGTWIEFRGEEDDEQDGDTGSNEANDTVSAIDNEDRFIEQQCFYDLDEDGYEEPYTVTIHHQSCKPVRIVARFDEQSIVVKYNDRIMRLDEAKRLEQQQRQQEFGGMGMLRLLGMQDPEVSDDDFDLLKIEPFQNICKYGFIPAPDGTFLSLGYSHLLGAMTQAINATTNQLTDAGTLENLSGGFLSKEFRKVLGMNKLRPGEWLKTDVPADKFANGVFPKPAQPPSKTLYQLGQDKLERAMGYLSVIDISGQIQANTAPTTALAIIQEAIIPTNALFSRILRAESKEFQILFRINQRTFDPIKYQQVLGDPQADPQTDFNSGMIVMSPTANADMSSQAQRIQTAQIEMEMFDRVLQAGGNPIPLVRNFFDAIDSDIVDQVFPEEGSMSPEEKQKLEALTKQTELQNQLQQLQLQILQREQERLDAKTASELEKARAEIEEISVDMVETLARAAKYAEEAESEQVKSQLDVYTSRIKAMTDVIKTIGEVNDRPVNIQSLVQPGANIAGPVQPMAQGPGNGGAF